MKRFAVAILGSVLTAAYWWVVFTIVYANALFAGDADPASQPRPDREVVIGNVAVIVVGVLVYAVLMPVWRRVTTSGRSSSESRVRDR